MKRSRDVEALLQTRSGTWLQMRDPIRIVEADTSGGVSAAIAEVERLTRDLGCYAAGYLAYEAGAAFGLPVHGGNLPSGLPLAWFALFEPANVRELDAVPAGGAFHLGPLVPSIDRDAFERAFLRIKEHLAAGDTYQVNFTFRMRGALEGDPFGLFAHLARAQQGRFSAFLRTEHHAICSASPELFFSLDGLTIETRPMKGTVRRGRTSAEDAVRREELRASDKQRAENVMIVDMMRNDLGKIADVGSVRVPDLFALERYPNVWQMTSSVTATTRASLEEIFAALHPSASITGAPKRRTMDVIRQLEDGPRGVYTGAIGYIGPDGNGRFNVAIRTALVTLDGGEVEFGVGSGIVWDSEAGAEYDECLLKGSVLRDATLEFELLETTAWTRQGGFAHLDRHLSRMRDSADFFGFAYAEGAVRAALDAAVSSEEQSLRVRWGVSRGGAVRVELQPLVPWGDRPMRVALAREAIDASDPFLFHKTTNRAVYARAREEGADGLKGIDEVILWNSRGEITEATTANVFVELTDGTIATPPVGCALLAGTARAQIQADMNVIERAVSIADLKAARRIWLTNSVHGRREAVLVEGEAL